MTSPVNKKLNYTISIPSRITLPPTQLQNTHSTQIKNIHNNSLRTSQSTQDNFSLKSVWDAFINFFKTLCPCFFENSHSPSQLERIQSIAASNGYVWFYKKEENELTAPFGNFDPCSINLWGLRFQCAEAAFQAAKFNSNIATMQRFQNLDGEAAFKLGRELSQNWTPVQTQQWRNNNLAVMQSVLTAKFTQNPHHKDLLLATGNAYLVEHIPVRNRDAYWGDNSDGTGQNWLGRLLMQIRASLGGTGEVPRNQQYNQFLTARR